MAYAVLFEQAALRNLEGLEARTRASIVAKVEALANDPRPHGCRTLAGFTGLYRLRVGQYRVIYRIQDDVLTVVVIKVGHRREVYRRG